MTNCIFSSCDSPVAKLGMCNDHTMLLQRIAADMWPGANFDDLLAGLGGDGGALQALIDAIVGHPGGTLVEVADVIGALGGADLAAFQQLLDALAGKPAASVADVAVWVAGLGSGGDVQPLLDLLGLKPNATVADVEVVWQALSDGSVSLARLLSLLSGKPLSANPTVEDVQVGLPILVQTIVDAAIAGLPAGTEVLAQQILDAFGGTLADLTAYVVGVDDNLATTTTMAVATQGGLEQFLTTVAGNPDPALITVPNGGLPGLAGKAWEALVAQVAAGGGTFDLEWFVQTIAGMSGLDLHDDQSLVASLKARNKFDPMWPTVEVWQGVLDGVTGKPGATPAEFVAAVLSSGLSTPQVQGLIDVALAGYSPDIPVLAEALLPAINGAVQVLIGPAVDPYLRLVYGILNGGKPPAQATPADAVAAVAKWNSLPARLDALEAENADLRQQIAAMQQTVDAIAAQQVTEHDWLLTSIQGVEADYKDLTAQVVEYAIETFAEKTALQTVADYAQAIADAMIGPNATPQMVAEMFWALSDLLVLLCDATGVNFPGGRSIGAGK